MSPTLPIVIASLLPALSDGNSSEVIENALPEGALVRFGTLQRWTADARSIHFTSDSTKVLVGGGYGYERWPFQAYDVKTGKREYAGKKHSLPSRVARDGRWLFLGPPPDVCELLDPLSGKRTVLWGKEGFGGTKADYSPDGKVLAVGSQHGAVFLLDA